MEGVAVHGCEECRHALLPRQIASDILATSTISGPSWTRRMSAPCAIAAQHVAAVPHARSFGSGFPQIAPMKPLREAPT